ncbi:hypothetical protein [Chitinophaga rhizosphaerae]|uniref:hypothetical protein n=1 Tax=Chitinophaga rhizosphaerae TaxID=1864947 RepID=UPI000F810813|nr:hypothetical protein [Chitinophaga rhizosphaerae]
MPFTFSHPAIVWVVMRLPADGLPVQPVNLRYWMLVCGWTMIIVAVRLLTGSQPIAIGNGVVTGIAAFLMGLVLAPPVLKWKLEGRAPR